MAIFTQSNWYKSLFGDVLRAFAGLFILATFIVALAVINEREVMTGVICFISGIFLSTVTVAFSLIVDAAAAYLENHPNKGK